MNNELWDIYDAAGNPTGRTHRRGEPLADGDYHLAVRAWIMNSKGEIFITKRADGKHGGGDWEVPGGAAISGETSLDAAVRETREEIGVDLQIDGAYKFYSYSFLRENCIIDHWLFLQEVTEVKLCEREVSDAKYATSEEINRLSSDGNFYCNTGLKGLRTFLLESPYIFIGEPAFPDGVDVIRRTSARGVCVRDGKALMIKYGWGGYGFPGGGIEDGETMRETITREIREEVGYNVESVGDLLTCVIHRKREIAYGHEWFEQPNFFFLCEVGIKDEQAREYESVWVDLQEALAINNTIPDRERDVIVLTSLAAGS
ncbi:MAG: NUDIX domain-containing protein [Oscillospiraceae bacterium]|jgi:mutator protein MutT|nr:NUDIX domain-containing protein [Oscillospiraceae bacterium]